MKILLMRFSALGDVAMLAPVVREYAARHTDDELWVMSKPFHAPLFEGMAPNVHFLAKDPKKDYKGIRGLYRLFRELDAMHFDLVVDEHDVLRTKFLRKLFRLHGYKVSHINKHRSLRRKITAPEGKKELFRLPTAFENYAMALGEPLSEKASSEECRVKSEEFSEELRVKREEFKLPFECMSSAWDSSLSTLHSSLPRVARIGIAPFAAHQGKIYPVERMERVIELLIERRPECRIILFGGGGKEREQMTVWAERYSNVELASTLSEELRVKSEESREALNASSEKLRVKSEKSHADDIQSNGNLNFSLTLNNSSSLSTLNSSLNSSLYTLHSSLYYELQLMKDLDVMVSMDSGNMHMASLMGTRVVSIWGATHPWAGFLGWGQSEADCVQRHDLKCRPCSIYGNKPCLRGDMECMNIEPSKVVEQLLK